MKEFKTVELTSDHLFAFCEVLDAIGIEKFAEIFNKENLEEFKNEEDTEKAGVAIGAKILKVLVKELPKAKNQIHTFLALCVENTTAEEIKNLPLVDFIKLIKTIFAGDNMKDFFTEATSLFVKA